MLLRAIHRNSNSPREHSLKLIVRSIVAFAFVAILFALPLQAQEAAPSSSAASSAPQVTSAPNYEITGSARSGKTPLPGAAVTAANTLTGKKYAAVTNADGKFSFSGIARGRYVVRIEFMGFSLFTQELLLNPQNPSAKVDAELLLASRQQQQSNNAGASIAAVRGFQSLAVDSTLSSLAGGDSAFGAAGAPGAAQNTNDLSSLPLNGAGAEGPTESVSISGAQGRTQDFGGGSEDELQQRIQEFRDREQGGGGPFGGGPGFGGPGGAGGGGPMAIGRLGGRGFNINQPHGLLYFSNDNASLDATPYSLNGVPAIKPQYNQSHFGANVGGPLKIPKLFDAGNKWFFFAGWNGSRGDSPYVAYSRVPTNDERYGNFAGATYNDGTPVQLFNPATGQQYQFNGIPNALDPSLISSSAKALLQYIPLPNMPPTASGQNFQYFTSAASSSDAVILRLVHNFGSTTGPGFGPPGGGGGRSGGRQQNNINFGLNWARTSTNIVNPFPLL